MIRCGVGGLRSGKRSARLSRGRTPRQTQRQRFMSGRKTSWLSLLDTHALGKPFELPPYLVDYFRDALAPDTQESLLCIARAKSGSIDVLRAGAAEWRASAVKRRTS